MTEEEIKNIDEMTDLLLNNGYRINNPGNFIRESGEVDITELVGRLKGLELSINEEVNVSEFAKDMEESLKSIEAIVNSDTYFTNSPRSKNFLNELSNLRNEFSIAQNYLKAEEIVKNRRDNLNDINSRISSLIKNKDIDSVTMTKESLKLKFALNRAEADLQESINFSKEQKALYDAQMKNLDIEEFRKKILLSINKLAHEAYGLDMESSAKEKLISSILNTQDKVIPFGAEYSNAKKEYENLLKKYGFEKMKEAIKEEVKNNTEVIENNVEESKDENIEEVKVETELNTDSENKVDSVLNNASENYNIEPTKEDVKTSNITNQEELIAEIKRLNPELKIGHREVDNKPFVELEDVNRITLPDSFTYDPELGINNKVDDSHPYVSLPVEETREKEEEETLKTPEPEVIEAETENVEPELIEEEPEVADTKVNMSSKVPSGKTHVKKTRRAVMLPYVKSILKFGGLGFAGAALLTVPAATLLPMVTVGATIGAVGQALHNLMVENDAIKLENYDEDYQKDPTGYSWSVPFMQYVKKSSHEMLDKFKSYVTRPKKSSTVTENLNEENQVASPIPADLPEEQPEIIETGKVDNTLVNPVIPEEPSLVDTTPIKPIVENNNEPKLVEDGFTDEDAIELEKQFNQELEERGYSR